MEICLHGMHSVTVTFYFVFVDVPRKNGSISLLPLEEALLLRGELKFNSL